LIVRSAELPLFLDQAIRAVARQQLPCAVKILGPKPYARILVACNPVRVVRGSNTEELAGAWQEARSRWGVNETPAVPVGVGLLSYDLGRRFERIPSALPAAAGSDIDFRFYDGFAVFQAKERRWEVWAIDDKAARDVVAQVCTPDASPIGEGTPAPPEKLVEMEPPERHLVAIRRALDYIHAGDIYQVNLARRLGCRYAAIPGEAPGTSLFLTLERLAPASHAIWLADAEDATAVVGNSPERFLRRSVDGGIETCPIKGTRPRAEPGSLDRNADILLGSGKDRAEHVMIVDLERNDLGRICETGSVRVERLCELMTLPTVYHMVTTVRGQLRRDAGLAEILRATFPGGSVTGAPKIRAMEIIEELEPARRGPYTGATGWLGAAGDFDLAVAIRTACIADDWLTLWVGGGIVADSRSEDELAETWAKAQAFRRALARPPRGPDEMRR
jgi:para-aminobenzoate synthetase component 1